MEGMAADRSLDGFREQLRATSAKYPLLASGAPIPAPTPSSVTAALTAADGVPLGSTDVAQFRNQLQSISSKYPLLSGLERSQPTEIPVSANRSSPYADISQKLTSYDQPRVHSSPRADPLNLRSPHAGPIATEPHTDAAAAPLGVDRLNRIFRQRNEIIVDQHSAIRRSTPEQLTSAHRSIPDRASYNPPLPENTPSALHGADDTLLVNSIEQPAPERRSAAQQPQSPAEASTFQKALSAHRMPPQHHSTSMMFEAALDAEAVALGMSQSLYQTDDTLVVTSIDEQSSGRRFTPERRRPIPERHTPTLTPTAQPIQLPRDADSSKHKRDATLIHPPIQLERDSSSLSPPRGALLVDPATDQMMVENAALKAQVRSHHVKQAIWNRRDLKNRGGNGSISPASTMPENSMSYWEEERQRLREAELVIEELESRLRVAAEDNKKMKQYCRDVKLQARTPQKDGNYEAKCWRIQKEWAEAQEQWAREKEHSKWEIDQALELHKREAEEHSFSMEEVRKLEQESDKKNDQISEYQARIRSLEHNQRMLQLELDSARTNLIHGAE